MRDLNKAMKKLQEAKRLESMKLAKLVKESVVEPEDKEETFDNKFNYKVSLDNGKTITATCSKENIEDARKYFLGKSYLNTKTGEKAKIVGVEEINSDENGFEEIKNEEFGSTSKQLTDNDPAQKVPFDSDAEKGIENAATQKPKIVAEEFGSENKDLTDNDPAQKKAFETETTKEFDDATKKDKVNDKVDESKKLNEATEEDINNENKLEKAKQLIEVIFNMDSLDETRRAAKQELKDLVYPQRIEPEKTEKKIVKESIFDNDEETKVKEDRLAELKTQLECDGDQLADDEKEAIQTEIDSLEKDLYESKKLKESIANGGDCTFSLKINCNNAAFGDEGDDELINETKRILNDVANKLEYTDKETILDSNGNKVGVYGFGFEGVMDPLKESKQLNESEDKCIMCNTTNIDGCYSIQGQTICKDCGKKYNLEEIEKMIAKINSKPINEERLGNEIFTDNDEAEYYRNKELYDNSGLARHRDAMEKAKAACKAKGIEVDETRGVYESKQLNEESTLGKDLTVVYIDTDGNEKVDYFRCDKNYELDGDQIREAIKSTFSNVKDIIKISESCENEGKQKPLNEEDCDDCSIENIDDETFTEAFTKFIKENYKNAKEFKLENVVKSGNNYRFECKLTFNSGKQVKVNLMSEAKIREGKSLIRFYENKTFKHLDENKSIMTATVKLKNKTLSCEGLRYNYRVALKENIATIKGIIK